MPKKSKKSTSSSKSPSKTTGSKLSKKSITAIMVGVVMFLSAVVLVVLFLLGVFDSKKPARPGPQPARPGPQPTRPPQPTIPKLPDKGEADREARRVDRQLRDNTIKERLSNPNGKMTCFDYVKRDPSDPDPNRKMPCLGYVTDKDDTYSIPPVQTDFNLKNNYGFIPIDRETKLVGDGYADPARSGGVPSDKMMAGKQCSTDDQCGWSSENNYQGGDKKTWVPFCCSESDSKCKSCGQLGRKFYPRYTGQGNEYVGI